MTTPKLQTTAKQKSIKEILDLEPIGENLFRGKRGEEGWRRVYGGQVLGQALTAASRTVNGDRSAHSLHSYFLLAGDPKYPIEYEVEQTRDGGSFSTRRVKALQHNKTIFTMSASFHKEEEGLEHQFDMPDVPPPSELPSAAELVAKHFDKINDIMRIYWQRTRPIEMRLVDPGRYVGKGKREPRQCIWLKAADPLPDDPALHKAVLAYASDFTLLDTALVTHGKLLFDTDIQLASLDHAIWFHRPFRADEWLLYAQDSPSAQNARGLCRGKLYTESGQLVASTAQEGLMRLTSKHTRA